MEYIQISTTFDDPSSAQNLATQLVETRLAACAQLEGPITSVYRWKAKIESEEEWRLVIKTRCSLFADVAATIAKMHKYDVPQIVATALVDISPAYAEWMNGELVEENSKDAS